MIIQSSSIGMDSKRTYASSQKSYSALSVWDNSTGESARITQDDFLNYMFKSNDLEDAEADVNEAEKENKQKSSDDAMGGLLERYNATQSIKNSGIREKMEIAYKIRQQAINYLLQLLFGQKCNKKADATQDLGGELTNTSETGTNNTLITLSKGGSYSSFYSFSEVEETSFSTTGTVVTADGTEISFGIEMYMSRSFYEMASETIDFGQARMMDPLVINLDNNVASVSDQKFLFDLDADGTEESISMLGSGSGYLALDKNEDGIINDGSELFGTKSGNGFADLAQYDSDGNGWIDEADEIFSKLKIWTIDENGNSKLCSLGQAGIGALYLGSADTEFSLNAADNTTNAVIRKTGMFLYENGRVGSLQQLDLAT